VFTRADRFQFFGLCRSLTDVLLHWGTNFGVNIVRPLPGYELARHDVSQHCSRTDYGNTQRQVRYANPKDQSFIGHFQNPPDATSSLI
jgi:hypothetical protein